MINGSSLPKLRIVAAFLALLLGAGAVAAHAGEPKIEQCLDPDICPITYVRLAKQETEPFFFYGKPVNETHRRYDEYRDTMSRFPDVRSCLVGSERTKPQPDLRQMDWAAVKSFPDLEVCVFRIATSIQDIDTIKVWLRHNEFSVGRNVKQRSDDFVPTSGTEPVLSIEAILSVENFRRIFPRPWLWKILGIEIVYNFSLGILLSRSGQIVGVSAIANIK